ncbi:MAG TPA: polyphosphate:AMP phosphotransferase [Mariprofundaceae bacterium]|nr:polyphosphate:AMP phosphotransferase [Mariprofundaceae bacterium]
MFRTAELGRKVGNRTYREKKNRLRQELLELQRLLREQSAFPVVVVFAGVDGGGKGATVNTLNDWMDPRWLMTRAYGSPSGEERERPEYWRFWRDLPPKGRVGLFLDSWYSSSLLDRVHNRINDAEFDRKLERVTAFEDALADDGALILKFWMHLGKKAQKRRLEQLQKDPLLSWRVNEMDWQHWRMHHDFVAAAERAITHTSHRSPWSIIEGTDPNYRNLAVATTIRNTMTAHLDRLDRHRNDGLPHSDMDGAQMVPETVGLNGADELPKKSIFSILDMSLKVKKSEYKKQLEKLQGRLHLLHRKALARGISTILLFEGQDAAGKGGAIRRVTRAMEARNYQVIPVAEPTDEERAHHYLWRFWRHLSRAGKVTIFDRSWYGRVLVERVEGLTSEQAWTRAYAEINDFEEQLVEHGIVLVKYWLQIGKDEQLARFRERQNTPYKRWKLTDEDWRNREKWDAYEQAVNDMVERTGTSRVPWELIEGNDKRYARLKVLRVACERLEHALGD